jgi:formylglycine-generating enzyme required for sulfatase activity
MSSSVWEWTSNLFSPYPYKAEDGREDLEAIGGHRMMRGGSFIENEDDARCSYRDSCDPD